MKFSHGRTTPLALALAGILGLGGLMTAGVVAGESPNDQDSNGHVRQDFGIEQPLDKSSSSQVTAAQASADPTVLATLAGGLQARVVTSGVAAPNIDQIALWPNDSAPTHLIFCNEEGVAQPGLQRLEIATGQVTTIMTGITAGDPVRRTPWGTILFGEEAGGGANGGRMYELIDPLGTVGVTLDRATGVFSGGTGAANFTPRAALGRLSFEGLGVYANGVTYFGDENRPSSGTPGGAYFKFVPTTLRTGTAPITNLNDSPLKAGKIYGLRVGKNGTAPGTDYGQGTSYGFGTWIEIPAAADPDLRAQAAALKLTGYYRPEDIDIDRVAEAAGKVRFCGANTGNEATDQYYGEVVCLTDGALADAATNGKPEVQLLVAGHPGLAMPDNVAFQPGRKNLIIHEDADTTYLTPHNNDLWDCLPDGQDEDLLSDGCIRIATLNDLTAEWTGGIFDATGKRFFVSVQHNITGKGVILEITGWK